MSTTIDTILKLSGHKDMKSFYREFPDEASFMAKHGGQFRKAMRGAKIKKAQGGQTMAPITPISTQQGWNSYYDTLPTGTEKLDDMGQGFDLAGMVAPGMKVVENVIKGFQQLKDEKRALQKAKQWSKVSDVNLQASQLTPEPIERKYTRPEDIINTGDKFFPVYGVGTDALAKKGKKIKKADFGTQVGSVLQGIGSDRLTNLSVGLSGGESAGATFGGAAGDIISMIPGVGPIVGTLAKPVLSAVGNLIDTNPEKTKRYQDRFEGNVNQMAMGKGMQGLFNQNNAYMQTGGKVSDMQRSGELRLMEGSTSPISYNPYGGETIMFNGPSHSEGGMNIAFGNTPVEVEGGEPAIKMQEGGTAENLIVYGNLKLPGYKKSAKNVVKDIAKQENILTQKAKKYTEKIGELRVSTPLDKIEFDTLAFNVKEGDKKLQKLAEEKRHIASLQEAINQTADEMGIDAERMLKGEVKKAKKGASVPKAQTGIKGKYILDPSNEDAVYQHPSINAASNYLSSGMIPTIKQPVYKFEYGPESEGGPLTVLPEIVVKPKIPSHTGKSSASTPSRSSTANTPPSTTVSSNIPEGFTGPPTLEEMLGSVKEYTVPTYTGEEKETTTNTEEEKKKRGWEYAMDALDTFLPYFRPSDTERLDPRQLMGEMFALTDKEEPVQAQFFHPQLGSPYSVSFADQKNDVIAQVRSAQRMAGNNPAAQAMIASQATQALNKINAEEFRMNQGMADKVYGENRATMNQAQLQNLGIADTQYTRQQQAKSNTKAIIQAALNSIGDKYMKNQLNNRTLATYENLYNYRFDDRYRAQNWNQPAQFNVDGSGNPELADLSDEREVLYRKKASGEYEPYDVRSISRTKSSPAKNGGIVRAMKNI